MEYGKIGPGVGIPHSKEEKKKRALLVSFLVKSAFKQSQKENGQLFSVWGG